MIKETVSIGDKGAVLTCYLHEFKQGVVKALPAILIIPGGAYFFTSEREADPVALTFLNAQVGWIFSPIKSMKSSRTQCG